MHRHTHHHRHASDHEDGGRDGGRRGRGFGARIIEKLRDHHHRGHGGHGGGGRGGRRGRLFEQGDLRLLLLMLIKEKPRHGYEIIRAIEDMVAGAYSPSPGTIYPTLTMLEDIGHTQVTQGENGRRLNQITADGLAYLEENAALVADLTTRIDQIRDAQAPATPPQILRATENFNLALRMRLARQPLTEEQAAAIAAVLDAAAVGIERT